MLTTIAEFPTATPAERARSGEAVGVHVLEENTEGREVSLLMGEALAIHPWLAMAYPSAWRLDHSMDPNASKQLSIMDYADLITVMGKPQ